MTITRSITICKTAILTISGLLLLAPLKLPFAIALTFICGLVIVISALACLSDSYKRPVCIFLALSALALYYYRLPLAVLVTGVNSMLPIVAIAAVLQLFAIPIKVGRFDLFLKQYLMDNFKTGGALYLFLTLVTHLLSTLLGFGAIPLVYSVFRDGIKQTVSEYDRFLVTAVSRGFSLSTFWAPGAVSVMLVLQATGAPWFRVFVPAVGMALLGIVTAAVIEGRATSLNNAGRPVAAFCGEGSRVSAGGGGSRKIVGLVVVIAAMVVLIVVMEQARILTSATRILTAGFVVAASWIMCYLREPSLGSAWREYWSKALSGMPGLAALFISVGIFSEVIDQAGLMARLLTGLTGSSGMLGQYSLLFVAPLLILLSLTGVHPFVSLLLVGKMLNPLIDMPNHDVLLAFSLLLGGSLSYAISPFAGTIITLSGLAGCSPGKAALKWNGPFAAILLLEGLAVLLVLQWFWGSS
jgi:hypothetical protein